MKFPFKSLKVRQNQGWQYVKEVRRVSLPGFRGKPEIDPEPCEESCTSCQDVCPTQAIRLDPFQLDLGRCVFCHECALVCPVNKITFTPNYRMATNDRSALILKESSTQLEVKVSKAIQKLFGRSLKLRSVSAGGCNACELELAALGSVNFDMGRYGIEFVASPRHADALVLSGPLTTNMARALELAYEGMPDPKFVIAVGACAISGGLYEFSPALDRAFLERFQPALYVPGCPPHPLTFLTGILDLLGRE
jgi:Ni,Fe-hydrogenase III small subunit/NAD-dependent dihydropyrimidine dehydrogenase PreA subunit